MENADTRWSTGRTVAAVCAWLVFGAAFYVLFGVGLRSGGVGGLPAGVLPLPVLAAVALAAWRLRWGWSTALSALVWMPWSVLLAATLAYEWSAATVGDPGIREPNYVGAFALAPAGLAVGIAIERAAGAAASVAGLFAGWLATAAATVVATVSVERVVAAGLSVHWLIVGIVVCGVGVSAATVCAVRALTRGHRAG